jgi:Family of unknown function (DUF6263)
MKKNVLVLMAVAAGFAATAQTFKPAVKLEAGKKYNVNTVTKANMTQEAMGQTMEIPIETSAYQLLEIKAAGNEGYQSASTTQRLVFSANVMGQDMNYDSDKKEDREGKMGATMNSMVGKPTTFTVGMDGKVIEKTVVKPDAPKDAEGGEGDMMTGMMSNMGLAQAGASPAFNLFPDNKEMKIGDTFVESVSNDKDGKTKTTTTYKLAAIKDGIAEFEFTGTGSIEKTMETQGMQMNIVSATKLSGMMLVDIATGLLSKKTTITETTGNIEVSGMQIPITGKATTTVEVAPAK